MTDGLLRPGSCVELPDLLFTAQSLGPVLIDTVWEQGQKEPLRPVTSLDFLYEARAWYKRRFGIETFFSDQKSRGFFLCHSHLNAPQRLSRLLIKDLMIALCLAYYWMVCLGVEVLRRGWQGIVHWGRRCDLSLFQWGLVWLEHCQSEGRPVSARLQMQPSNESQEMCTIVKPDKAIIAEESRLVKRNDSMNMETIDHHPVVNARRPA